jgi:hypothetical protein
VTTRPVAEPTWSSAPARRTRSAAGRGSRAALDVDDRLGLAALGDRARDLAHDVGDLALEVPDAGLVRVRLDELGHRLVGDLDVLRLEAVVLHLLGDEEPLADLDLLALGVARDLDDLHPVAERHRDRVDEVAGGDEQHLAEVERHLEVVVLEAVVLLGSRTSSRADDGSPRKSMPTLSISSSMNTGLFVPAVLTFWMIRPGSAPM